MTKLNKFIYFILFLLLIIFGYILLNDKKVEQPYSKEYSYFNETIILTIYTTKDSNKIFNEIDNIYKKYEKDDVEENKEEYLNQLIKEYLEKEKIEKYTINMNDTILVSNHKFKIGLPDPDNELNVLKVINVSGKCVSTINTENKEYKSVTIISSNKCETLAQEISDLTIEEGIKYIDNLHNVDAIWYTNYNKFIKSKNFKKYE